MDDTTNYQRYKSKDLLEVAYKNRHMYNSLLKSKQSQDLVNRLYQNSLSRELSEKEYLSGTRNTYDEPQTTNNEARKATLKRIKKLEREIFLDEDVEKTINGKKYLLDKSTGDLYSIKENSGCSFDTSKSKYDYRNYSSKMKCEKSNYMERGQYVGKLMEDGSINESLPKSEEIEIKLKNIIDPEDINKTNIPVANCIHQTETGNVYLIRNPVPPNKSERVYLGKLNQDNTVDYDEPEKDLVSENYMMKNFIFLTEYEKKMLIYLIDYFFNFKYNGLRNIILNSLYDNQLQKTNKTENKNINYAVSLDIEIDLCKLFIHLHLLTKYKKIIDVCESLLYKETKGANPTKTDQATMLSLFEFMFKTDEYFDADQIPIKTDLSKKPVNQIKPILYAQILELKKRFCEKLAENRTELKNSIKYIQRIIIILLLKNNLLKTSNDKLLSQIIVENEKYIYDIFRLQDFSIIKEKLLDITNTCNSQSAKYSFFNQFIETYPDLKATKLIDVLNCQVKKIKQTMISNVCDKLEKEGVPLTKDETTNTDPITVAKFIDDIIKLATNVGTFAIDTIVNFIPQNQAVVEEVQRRCKSEVTTIQQTEDIAEDLTKIFKNDIDFSKINVTDPDSVKKAIDYKSKYSTYLNSQNIVKKMKKKRSNVFNNNKPLNNSTQIIYGTNTYSPTDIQNFNKALLMLQTVSMKDLNDTFTDFNTYTIIDFMEDLIKYGLVPEFIDTSKINNSITLNDDICDHTTLTQKKKISECGNKYSFRNKYLSDGKYKKNTFKEFILFMHKKLAKFSNQSDITQILKNEYKNNICLDDETYITISNFYNIFKSLAFRELKNKKMKPNDKFITFEEIEKSRLKLVGKYDIARFNQEFKKELEDQILKNIDVDEKKSIMSKVLKGHDPFNFNVLMYYFYDISQEEEYLSTFVSFIVNSKSEQDKLIEQLVEKNLEVNAIQQLSDEYVSFEFEIDNSNSIQTINLLEKQFDNIVVVTKHEGNIILDIRDSEYKQKLNAIKQKYGTSILSITKLNLIGVDMVIILTQQELDSIKNNPELNQNILIKELEKTYIVEFTVSSDKRVRNDIKKSFPDAIITQEKEHIDLTAILDNSQRDKILSNYPETKFTEIGKEKIQMIIKSNKDRAFFQSELQSKFPNMNIDVNITNSLPSNLFQIQTDYTSAIKIKNKYGNNAKINFNLEFIVSADIPKSSFQSLPIKPISITETEPINLFGGALNEGKLYILQTTNKNKGSNRLKNASFELSKLFSNLNYKVKYIDILMNKRVNKKLLKKTRKRIKKMKGSGTKRFLIKFAVANPLENSVEILKELTNTSGNIKLEPEKITVVGVEGNPGFKEELKTMILGNTSIGNLHDRFGNNIGYISEQRKNEILAESEISQAKQEAFKASTEAKAQVEQLGVSSDVLELMFDD